MLFYIIMNIQCSLIITLFSLIMCVSVAFTAGCTFSTEKEAIDFASTKLDQLASDQSCINTAWTAACSFTDIGAGAKAANLVLEKTSPSNSKVGCVSTLYTAVCSV